MPPAIESAPRSRATTSPQSACTPRSRPLCAHTHLSFFFFQAEDGIRDLTVTGVQTCALPISGLRAAAADVAGQRALRRDIEGQLRADQLVALRCAERRGEALHLRRDRAIVVALGGVDAAGKLQCLGGAALPGFRGRSIGGRAGGPVTPRVRAPHAIPDSGAARRCLRTARAAAFSPRDADTALHRGSARAYGARRRCAAPRLRRRCGTRAARRTPAPARKSSAARAARPRRPAPAAPRGDAPATCPGTARAAASRSARIWRAPAAPCPPCAPGARTATGPPR